MALFIPLAAIVFSLKNCEGYIRAILIKQLENEKLSRGAGKCLSPFVPRIKTLSRPSSVAFAAPIHMLQRSGRMQHAESCPDMYQLDGS